MLGNGARRTILPLVTIAACFEHVAGRSGLAVACLTAVREVRGSNRAVGSCVYRKNHCDLQPWARVVRTVPAVPSQLSLLPYVGR